MNPDSIEVLAEDEIFRRRNFRWLDVRFAYTRFDGTNSGAIQHLVFDRGNCVGILLHDVPNDEVILVEQVRIATVRNGPGRLLEIPAGVIDHDENARETAIREAREETGAEPAEVEFVASFYLSPGACTERLSLFYCPFRNGIEISDFGGLPHEDEDIRVHRIRLSDALAMIVGGEIIDAKSILALFWLNQPSHFRRGMGLDAQ